MEITSQPYDAAEYFDSDAAIEEFLAAAFEEGDPAVIAKCVGVVARARNMSQLARDVGMSRSALYKALSGEGNPEFASIMKILDALGVKLSARIVTRSNQDSADHEAT
jgi:probable addiction module antidote protein